MFKCPGKLLSSALALTALGFLISCLSTAPAAEEKSETKAEKKSEKAVGETKGRVGAPWTMWGGTPSRNMVNEVEKNIPAKWDVEKGTNIKWKQKLGSQSYGNPVIANDRILVGTNNQLERNSAIKGDKGIIMCFNEADGKFLWQVVHDKLEVGRVNDWPEQGICSAPVVEGKRFWYVSNRAEVVCADLDAFLDDENDGPYKEEKYTSKIDGDIIWIFDMMDELDAFPHNLATCSPVVAGDIIFINTSNGVDEGHVDLPSSDAPSFIALNKNTGELIWEDDSPGENILHGQWSSPTYGTIAGVGQVIFAGGDGWVYSFKPENGDLLWKFDCNPKGSKWELGRGDRNNIISTPVVYKDRVYIAVGQDPEHGEGIGHMYAIDPKGKSGDITSDKGATVWHFGNKDYYRTISTVAIRDGLVYTSDLSGFFYCLDLESGKLVWKHDLLAAVWGSPTVIDGKVYLGDEEGKVVVLREGRKKELLAENDLFNAVYTTPVAAHGVLYVANRTTLYAIEKK